MTTAVRVATTDEVAGLPRPMAAARLDQIARQQEAAERKMLACMARSAEEFMQAHVNWEAPTIPVHMSPANLDFLCALALIHEEVHKPPTADVVDEMLRDLQGDSALAVGGGAALWSWLPNTGDVMVYANEVTRLAAARWDMGQRVWREALYRWYDIDRRLIYVGITSDLHVRQSSHVRKSSWTQFASISVVQRYPTRGYSEWAERRAICDEQPLFNHQHNDTSEARQRLVEYLIEQGRTDLLTAAVSRG
jgi:hypothetical protein